MPRFLFIIFAILFIYDHHANAFVAHLSHSFTFRERLRRLSSRAGPIAPVSIKSFVIRHNKGSFCSRFRSSSCLYALTELAVLAELLATPALIMFLKNDMDKKIDDIQKKYDASTSEALKNYTLTVGEDLSGAISAYQNLYEHLNTKIDQVVNEFDRKENFEKEILSSISNINLIAGDIDKLRLDYENILTRLKELSAKQSAEQTSSTATKREYEVMLKQTINQLQKNIESKIDMAQKLNARERAALRRDMKSEQMATANIGANSTKVISLKLSEIENKLLSMSSNIAHSASNQNDEKDNLVNIIESQQSKLKLYLAEELRKIRSQVSDVELNLESSKNNQNDLVSNASFELFKDDILKSLDAKTEMLENTFEKINSFENWKKNALDTFASVEEKMSITEKNIEEFGAKLKFLDENANDTGAKILKTSHDLGKLMESREKDKEAINVALASLRENYTDMKKKLDSVSNDYNITKSELDLLKSTNLITNSLVNTEVSALRLELNNSVAVVERALQKTISAQEAKNENINSQLLILSEAVQSNSMDLDEAFERTDEKQEKIMQEMKGLVESKALDVKKLADETKKELSDRLTILDQRLTDAQESSQKVKGDILAQFDTFKVDVLDSVDELEERGKKELLGVKTELSTRVSEAERVQRSEVSSVREEMQSLVGSETSALRRQFENKVDVINTDLSRKIEETSDQIKGNIDNEIYNVQKELKGSAYRLEDQINVLDLGINSRVETIIKEKSVPAKISRTITKVASATKSGAIAGINGVKGIAKSSFGGIKSVGSAIKTRAKSAGSAVLESAFRQRKPSVDDTRSPLPSNTTEANDSDAA